MFTGYTSCVTDMDNTTMKTIPPHITFKKIHRSGNYVHYIKLRPNFSNWLFNPSNPHAQTLKGRF